MSKRPVRLTVYTAFLMGSMISRERPSWWVESITHRTFDDGMGYRLHMARGAIVAQVLFDELLSDEEALAFIDQAFGEQTSHLPRVVGDGVTDDTAALQRIVDKTQEQRIIADALRVWRLQTLAEFSHDNTGEEFLDAKELLPMSYQKYVMAPPPWEGGPDKPPA